MKDNEKVTLTFTHIRTKETTVFTFEKNYMTPDWLFLQNGGNPYVMDKLAVNSMIRSVKKKSKENNLPCEEKIEKSIYHKNKKYT